MPISSRLLHDIENNSYKEEVLNLTPHAGLNEDVLCDEDIIELSHVLAKNKHIKQIILSYNKISDKGLEALANIETIEGIDLSNGLDGYDDVYNDITPAGLLSLTKSHLKKLNLSGNRRVGDDGLKILAKNQTIVELDVSDCSLTSAGVKEFFATNTTVTNLKLGSNDITDEGLQTVKLNQALRELDLAFCNVTSVGLIELIKNRSLLKVILYENNIKETDLAILTGCYFKLGRKLAFTRTEEDIVKYFSKKSHEIASSSIPLVSSADTLPPSPPVISNPLASNPVIFTPTHKRTLPSSTQEQERVEDSPPRKVAVTSTPQYQEFVHIATPEQMQEFYRALQEAYELAHRQQTSLSGPPLTLSSK